MRIGSAHPSNPRTRSVGRATPHAEADIRSYDFPAALDLGGAGTDGRRVRSGIGLGERKGPDQAAGDQLGEEALPLLRGAVLEQPRHHDRVLDRYDRGKRTVRSGDLDQRERIGYVIARRAAIFLGGNHAEQAIWPSGSNSSVGYPPSASKWADWGRMHICANLRVELAKNC